MANKKTSKGVGGLRAPSPEDEAEIKKENFSITFVFENASLEYKKIHGRTILLSTDEYKLLKNSDEDKTKYRPDILHQTLLALIDSPLCQTGKIDNIFVRTEKNSIIKIDPKIRIPRTYTRFAGVILQVLKNLKIREVKSKKKLMRMVKGPMTRNLDMDPHIIYLTRTGNSKKTPKQLISSIINMNRPIVFIIGAYSHGTYDVEYAHEKVSISALPLSAACCVTKITNALEEALNIT